MLFSLGIVPAKVWTEEGLSERFGHTDVLTPRWQPCELADGRERSRSANMSHKESRWGCWEGNGESGDGRLKSTELAGTQGKQSSESGDERRDGQLDERGEYHWLGHRWISAAGAPYSSRPNS